MACLKFHHTLQEIDKDHKEIIVNHEDVINASDVTCFGIILDRN